MCMYFPELTILKTNQRVIRLQEQIPGVLVVFLTLISYYFKLINCQLIILAYSAFHFFYFVFFSRALQL